MTGTRIIIVLCTVVGLGLIGTALGLIYMDFRAREGAWMELTHDPLLSKSERDLLMDAWEEDSETWVALVTGSLGAATFGAGAVLLLMELRWFQRREAAC